MALTLGVTAVPSIVMTIFGDVPQLAMIAEMVGRLSLPVAELEAGVTSSIIGSSLTATITSAL